MFAIPMRGARPRRGDLSWGPGRVAAMDPAGGSPVDARRARFEQGVVAVSILAGFVFRVPLVLPFVAAVLAAGVAFGSQANVLHRLFDAALAPRLGPPVHVDDPDETRFADLLAAALLGLASLLLLVDLGGIAWILALVQAVASALRATAGIHVGASLYARFRR